jgi:hypothetical protein
MPCQAVACVLQPEKSGGSTNKLLVGITSSDVGSAMLNTSLLTCSHREKPSAGVVRFGNRRKKK